MKAGHFKLGQPHARLDNTPHRIDQVASLVCEMKQVVNQAGLILKALIERMSRSALPGGMQALISDLVKPVEKTPILESRKDGKGTAHHPAVSPPTSSREPFQIALEDRGIECARVTRFDTEQTEAGSKKVANIGGNGSQTWNGPVNGNQLAPSIPL